jgi:hypothetical protein
VYKGGLRHGGSDAVSVAAPAILPAAEPAADTRAASITWQFYAQVVHKLVPKLCGQLRVGTADLVWRAGQMTQ